MKVTKITIGRLYNLGNYEHIRYEVTVEVPAGESAATACMGLEKILERLNPKMPHGVPSQGELRTLAHSLASTRESDDQTIRRDYGVSKYGRIRQLTHQLAEGQIRLSRWEKQRHVARILLQDVGGAANLRDAKDDWSDLDDSEF